MPINRNGWTGYAPDELHLAPAWCEHVTFACEHGSEVSMLMEQGWMLISPQLKDAQRLNAHYESCERERQADLDRLDCVSSTRHRRCDKDAHEACSPSTLTERSPRMRRILSALNGAQWMLNLFALVALVSVLR